MSWKGCARIFVMIFASLSGLYSQSYQGTISGTVTDKTGAVIAGAAVTVTDPSKGVSRVLKTNNAGQYSAPNLEPGTYTFTAQATGFQRMEKNGVMLDVGKSRSAAVVGRVRSGGGAVLGRGVEQPGGQVAGERRADQDPVVGSVVAQRDQDDGGQSEHRLGGGAGAEHRRMQIQ